MIDPQSTAPTWVMAAAGFGVHLSGPQIDQFDRYEQLLIEWNQRLNLTAITDPAEIRVRHFLDSLSCALAINRPGMAGQRLVDIGSGAGFPGLPLAIAFPELEVTVVDSVAKKVRFLETVIAKLGLGRARALAVRAEDLGRDPAHREQYDWVFARSVAEMRVLSEYLLPLCRPGGLIVAQKGTSAPAELAAAVGAIRQLGGSQAALIPVELPGVDSLHYLVVVEKTGLTPERFPRRPGMPAKRPLD